MAETEWMWISTREAMDRYGVKRTVLQDLARRGRVRTIQIAGRGGFRWYFDAGDLARVREEQRLASLPLPRSCGGEPSLAAYHRGCRCDGCRALQAGKAREQLASRYVRRDSAEFVHGEGGYSNWGCRCDVCCEAHRVQMANNRESRTRRAKAGSSDVPHGVNGYRWGCRCSVCKAAWAVECAPAVLAARKRALRESQRFAVNDKKPWSEEDLAVLEDRSLTIAQQARLLGRTIASVQSQRTTRAQKRRMLDKA